MNTPSPLRLVLVDDNETFLAALRAYLESIENVVIAGLARSGEQAVALSSVRAPDLVVMDLAMPGIGGLEATRILKSLPRAPLVAVVTFQSGESFRRAALQAGADFFIAKDRFNEEFPAVLAGMVKR